MSKRIRQNNVYAIIRVYIHFKNTLRTYGTNYVLHCLLAVMSTSVSATPILQLLMLQLLLGNGPHLLPSSADSE